MVKLALLLVLLALPAAAQNIPIPCKEDLVPGGGLAAQTPTDVVVDAKRRMFVLFGRDGGAEAIDAEGQSVMKLESGKTSGNPTHFQAISLWTGPGQAPAVLAHQGGPEGAAWVLSPTKTRIEAVRLRGAPNPFSNVSVVARGPDDGRIYVLDSENDPARIYVFSPTGTFLAKGSFAGLGRVRRISVDHGHNLYAQTDRGLVVYSRLGSKRYTLQGVKAFYLSREDRLAAAGSDWIRKFDLKGNLLVEARPPGNLFQPEAVSMTSNGAIFAYYAGGHLVKYDAAGEVEQEYSVSPGHSGPGYGLDGQGRLLSWDMEKDQLVMRSPNNQVLLRAGYVPGAAAPDQLVNPIDSALAPDGTIWIAEAGSSRLQRWHPEKGWQEPIAVGIRGGAARATPLQLKFGPGGQLLLLVVEPGGGNLMLQRRDGSGKLLAQRDLGPFATNNVAKLAVLQNGEMFLYRNDFKLRPTLEHFDARGNRVGRVGGEDPNFSLSGSPNSGIFMKPEEDLIPYKDGLILPTNGLLVYLDNRMKIFKVQTLKHERGAAGRRVAPDFGGAWLTPDGVLFIADLANQCIHKVPLR